MSNTHGFQIANFSASGLAIERRTMLAALAGGSLAAGLSETAQAQPRTEISPLLGLDGCSPFRGKSLEARITELCDREEIRELIAHYAHRVARGIPFADLFTDDGVWIVRFPGKAPWEVNGRKALEETFGPGSRKPGDQPLPMLHNVLLKIDGDNAAGICSNELRKAENGRSMIGSGYYDDKYRRVDGCWKFVRRDMTFIHWVPIQEGWAGKTRG